MRNHTITRPNALKRGLAAIAAVAAAAALALGASAPANAQPARPHLDPAKFQGVNWADPRDNFANDAVIPSGLSAADSPQLTYAKASQILAGFKHNLGANTVRLPVNPYSVGSGSAWWPEYREAIRAAEDLGFKVILSYWEGPGAKDDGIVDDYDAWWSMWGTLTASYAHDPRVYFEPMNEPHGYAQDAWVALVTSWLATYTAVPRDRVFVSGVGYSDHVNALCGIPALDGTYLALHDYGFWGTRSYADWRSDFAERIGSCADRTVLDEFGAPMTTGIDYRADATSADAATNNFVAFMQAATDTVRALHLGAVYWPGLRTGDIYSLETLDSSGGVYRLTDSNPSGVALVEWGWGRGHTSPHPAY